MWDRSRDWVAISSRRVSRVQEVLEYIREPRCGYDDALEKDDCHSIHRMPRERNVFYLEDFERHFLRAQRCMESSARGSAVGIVPALV